MKSPKTERRLPKMAIPFFLLAMLLLTFFCWKLCDLLTPQVVCVSPRSGGLERVLSAEGSFADGEVRFAVPLEQSDSFAVGKTVVVTAANLNAPLTLPIATQEYDQDKNRILCRVRAPGAALLDGQPCAISRTDSLGAYDTILPAACVYRSGDLYFTYLAVKTDSIWSPVIVRKTMVQVKADNGVMLAVSGMLDPASQVVQYSGEPLSDGMGVRLAKTGSAHEN